jgi:hypothetical protein
MINGVNHIFSLLALILSFLPALLFWTKKLAPDKTYLLIAIFWATNGIENAPTYFQWHWYEVLVNQIIIYVNLLDAPLILLIFYFNFRKKIFLNILYGFIILEAVVIAWKGFNIGSINMLAVFGGLTILPVNGWFIYQYIKNINHSARDNVMVFACIGFIFYYCLFFEITFVYGYLKSAYSPIQFELFSPYGLFVCYIAIFLSTLLVSYGLWKYALPGKRINN